MRAGYEVFTPDPGTVDEMHCRVCNSRCIVERNRFGSTGFAMGMARKKRHHDFFYCPHAEEEWHMKALELFQAIEKMPSRRVAELMRKDLDEVLEEGNET